MVILKNDKSDINPVNLDFEKTCFKGPLSGLRQFLTWRDGLGSDVFLFLNII